MKRILIATLVMLYVLSPVQGQNSQEASKKINEAALNLLRERNGGSAAQEASNEINEGAQQYRAGNFIEAQRHFERTLELDPSNKNARLFTARAIHAQYRPRS